MSEQIIDSATCFSQYSSVNSNYTDSDARSSDLGIGNSVRGQRFSYSGIELGLDQKPITNFKKSIEVEKNLHRLSSLQENCSSINVKNKLRGVIEHSYKVQIQNLMDELNQTKLDKGLLEKKLQLQVKNQIDYISEVRQSMGNNNLNISENQNGIQQGNVNQYIMLIEKLKQQETQQKELEFQVQELTTELKMTKVSQIQQKKQIEKLNNELEQAKNERKEINETSNNQNNDHISVIQNLQTQLNEYKQKYQQQQMLIEEQKQQLIIQNDDVSDNQKMTQTTETCCSCKNILLTESISESNKSLNNLSEIKYLTKKLVRDEEKPINYLLKSFNHQQINQIRKYQSNRRTFEIQDTNNSLQTLENDQLSDKENLSFLQKQIEIEKFKRKALDVDNSSLYNKLIKFYEDK